VTCDWSVQLRILLMGSSESPGVSCDFTWPSLCQRRHNTGTSTETKGDSLFEMYKSYIHTHTHTLTHSHKRTVQGNGKHTHKHFKGYIEMSAKRRIKQGFACFCRSGPQQDALVRVCVSAVSSLGLDHHRELTEVLVYSFRECSSDSGVHRP